MHIEVWQFVVSLVVVGVAGVLAGASPAYSLGRRHGIEAMAKHWSKSVRDDERFKKFNNTGD